MILFLRLFGSLLAHLPVPVIRLLVLASARVIFLAGRRRRRGLLANLRHAFPERDDRWIVATGRESVRQMVEFGLLAVALPCFSERRLRALFSLQPDSAKALREVIAREEPVMVLAPHLGPQEGLALLPLFLPGMPAAGAIYRPIKNQAVDRWIRESRERFGVRLFSRKQGLQSAIRLLRARHWLCLLFDQNASRQGALLTFLDRVASATELPGILAARHRARVVYMYAARTGFWKIELRAEVEEAMRERDEVNLAAHRWLESLLRRDEKLLPSWLWAHNRWRHQRVPQLCLRERKNLLERQNVFLGRPEVPRREPIFIRLPDRMEEVERLLPLLEAVRRARPDAALTVVGAADLVARVEREGLCEHGAPLPPGFAGGLLACWRLRRRFPSACFVFSDTGRAGVEAWLTGAPHRFAITGPNRRRYGINRPWTPPSSLAADPDPAAVWKALLRAHGLEAAAAEEDSTEDEEND